MEILKRFTKGASKAGLAMLNAIVDRLNGLLAWVENLQGDEYIYVIRGESGGILRLDIDAVLRRVPRPTGQQVMDAKVTGATGSTYTVLLGAYGVTGTFEAFNTLSYDAIGEAGAVVDDIVQVMPRFTDTSSGETTMTIIGAPKDGFFPVLVKSNGTLTGGKPAYDLYGLWDTGYTSNLNGTVTLAPTCSRARQHADIAVTAAADGSVGSAYYSAIGGVLLFDCPETWTKC